MEQSSTRVQRYGRLMLHEFCGLVSPKNGCYMNTARHSELCPWCLLLAFGSPLGSEINRSR